MSWILTGISGDGTGNITGGISFFSASLLPNQDEILKFLNLSLALNLFAEASSLFLLSSSHGFNCETYCIIKLPFCTARGGREGNGQFLTVSLTVKSLIF